MKQKRNKTKAKKKKKLKNNNLNIMEIYKCRSCPLHTKTDEKKKQ